MMKIISLIIQVRDMLLWTWRSLQEITSGPRRRALDFFKAHPRLALFPALGFGIFFFVFMVATKSGPEKSNLAERAIAARTIDAQQVAVVPRAVGYGYIQPVQTWEAVAEVKGRVTYMHPDLNEGGVIGKGAVILRIDPSQSELAREQSEADVMNVAARIKELDQREADLRRTFATENKALELSRKDLGRYRQLVESGTIAASELDRVEQGYLARSNTLHNYRSQLNRIPAEREALNAQLTASRSRSEDARMTVEKTAIVAPFDCRVAALGVQLDQAVQVGKVLAVLNTMGQSEVLAQVPLYTFQNLLPHGITALGHGTGGLQAILGFNAVIRVDFSGHVQEWVGSVSRVADEVDPSTRTIGVYVSIESTRPGSGRPPLIKNMYAEVEIRGEPLGLAVVVPRSVVRQNMVYAVDAQNRLIKRNVVVDMMLGDVAVLASGLAPGESIVVSDLIPAIEGMLLEPVDDSDLRESLVRLARGEGDVK